MSRGRSWPPAVRTAALDAYVEHGPREAARLTGVPASTIATWAAADGATTDAPCWRTGEATETRMLRTAGRKLRLAGALLDDVTRLRAELFAPAVTRHALPLGTGPGREEVALVDVATPQPTFADQLQLMQAIGRAVDEIVALTGDYRQTARDSLAWYDQPGHR